MSAYFIASIEQIDDRELYKQYTDKVASIVKQYGGEYLLRSDKVTCMSGQWQPQKLIVIKFESAEQLQKCFNSQSYLKIAPLREKSVTGRAIIVDGIEPVV